MSSRRLESLERLLSELYVSDRGMDAQEPLFYEVYAVYQDAVREERYQELSRVYRPRDGTREGELL